jgi:sodium-dependent dicarboxylate transporter 2/3/5
MLLVGMAAAVLWMSEAVPLAITSLVVILAVSGLSIMPLQESLSLVFHPVSAIVLAGFCIATALQKYGLDRRLSLGLLVRMGERTDRVILGMMVATALLSTVISNTAATAIMVAVGISILRTAGARPGQSNLGRAMLLGIPFAASIGGMGTPAGTPGNAITIALLRDMTGISLSFVTWTLLALPVIIVLLPMAWRLLIAVYPPEFDRLDLSECRRVLREMGGFSPGEMRVAAIAALAIVLWGLEPVLRVSPDWTSLVGLLAVVLLSLPHVGVLKWQDIHEHTGWNVFLLVGGGLAMGTGLLRTGAVTSVAGMVTPLVAGWPGWTLVVSVSVATVLAIVVFCTISGTVTTLVPLAVGLALAAGKGPGALAMVAALSASFAFLLPANSAPNALAYGTGYFRSLEMLRAGIMLIAVSIVVVVLIADLLWPVLGFRV